MLTLTLRLTSGPSAGQSLVLENELVIGRESGDLVIEDDELSRRHAAVRPKAGGVEIEDLDSLNGTFVNGQRIEEPISLGESGRLRVGQTEIAVEIISSIEPASGVTAPSRIPAPDVTAARPIPEPDVTVAREIPDPDVTAPRPIPQPEVTVAREIPDPDVTAARPIPDPDVTAARPVPGPSPSAGASPERADAASSKETPPALLLVGAAICGGLLVLLLVILLG